MIKNVTMGSDLETFLKTLDGQFFPSCGILGGTKDKPRAIGGGYFIQEDNVLLEGNIPVCYSEPEFVDAIGTLINKCSKQLPPSLRMVSGSSCNFPEMYIKHVTQASVFGCDPDFNAWTMEQNPRPHATNPYFRTASAHVHIGWDEPTNEDKINLIKWADVCVSLPSLFESDDRSRRELYGKAGAFRPKDYGVEHRVLDNYWIWAQLNIASVYRRYMIAVAKVNDGKEIAKGDEVKIQKAINTYDTTLASELMKKYK